MEWLIGILGLVVGAAIGAGVAITRAISQRAAIQSELANAQARAQMLEEQVRSHLSEIDRVRTELDRANQVREAAERQAAVLTEQKRILEEAEKKLSDTFASVGGKALRDNNAQFLELAKQTFEKLMKEASGDVEKKQQAIDNLVKPIKELLEKQNKAVGDIETKRETAYARLDEQIKGIALSHEKLNSETSRLASAMSKSQGKGKWGELQLRNVVELAGMCEHCDFNEQVTVWRGDEISRPDMLVRVPGRGFIPIDAKVSLEAYLAAMEPNADRATLLKRHAQTVHARVSELSQKKYWEAFENAPQIVVMFVPLESALTAALEVNPNLHADAMQQHVLIATPTLLVALLRAVAYGWQQESLRENIRDIAKVGDELYRRLSTFVGHFEDVGRALERSNKAYNSAVGSLESKLMPSARKLKELHATTEAEIESPTPIEIEVRQVLAPELKSLPASVD